MSISKASREPVLMPASRLEFGDFTLDIGNRLLRRGEEPVALNSRYFDALVLLVREHGALVPKQRMFDEVWAGSVVSDAALTQCIKEIRRQLGDDAAQPRYVRTVAGHGYCFIAPVRALGSDAAATAPPLATATGEPMPPLRSSAVPALAQPAPNVPANLPGAIVDGLAAAFGGAVAGLTGGLLYGSVLAWSPPAQSLGTLSVLLVLLALCVAVGFAGALGVGLGLGAGRRFGAAGMLAGAALGGLLVGGSTRLLGADAFALLVGHAPAGTTGGLEGAAIGLALAGGYLAGGGAASTRAWPPVVCAAFATGAAGALIALAGGSMMAQSLASVAAAFDQSRLDMAALGRVFGEPQFGTLARTALGVVEGAMFGACVAAALWLAHRRRPAHRAEVATSLPAH